MNDFARDYASSYDPFAVDAARDERAAFIRKTYLHLGGAVALFAGLEALFLTNEGLRLGLLRLMGGAWWIALIAFAIVSFVASRWARSGASPAVQYLGLGLYAVAEAIIFVPLLTIASMMSPDIVPAAGVITLVTFGGLTGIVFVTKADFSFLRGLLVMLTLASVGVVIASFFVHGLTSGVWFSGAMVALMAGWILYDTSAILHHYRTDQHVAAALELFASLATLFWYVIRLLMVLQRDD